MEAVIPRAQGSDNADAAEAVIETLINAAITTARRATSILDTTNPTGHCFAEDCDMETGPNRRWCCPECRDVWEIQQRP